MDKENQPPNPFRTFELAEVPPAEACWRIERLCLDLLRDGYVECQVPDRNVRLCVDGALRVGATTRTIHGDEALARALLVLQICHSILREGKTATTREIFYRNKRRGVAQVDGQLCDTTFLNEQQCERAILLGMYLVGVTRGSLGLTSSNIGKGLVAGLSLADPKNVMPLPHFMSMQELIPRFEQIRLSARPPQFLLIVEKHSVLHRLAQSSFLDMFPCIAVTGRGFPDLNTRRFCRAVRDYFQIPCFGMCDLNPHGWAIMGTYCYGSIKYSGESYRYVLSDMIILGMMASDLHEYANLCEWTGQAPQYQAFTAKDRTCLDALIASAQMMGDASLLEELLQMKERYVDHKLELEAFEQASNGYLYDTWLSSKVHAAMTLLMHQGQAAAAAAPPVGSLDDEYSHPPQQFNFYHEY